MSCRPAFEAWVTVDRWLALQALVVPGSLARLESLGDHLAVARLSPLVDLALSARLLLVGVP